MAELLTSYAQMFDCQVTENSETPAAAATTTASTTTSDPPTTHNGNVLVDFFSKYNQKFVNLDLVIEVLDFVDSCSTPGVYIYNFWNS